MDMIGFILFCLAISSIFVFIGFIIFDTSQWGEAVKVRCYEKKLLKIIEALSNEELEKIKKEINDLKRYETNSFGFNYAYRRNLQSYLDKAKNKQRGFGDNVLNKINSIQSLNIRIKELEKELGLK